MELVENLFKLWWELFLSLSTLSKIFIIVVGALIVLGAIEKEKKKKQEEKIREAKLKTLQEGKEEEKEKEKSDDYLL